MAKKKQTKKSTAQKAAGEQPLFQVKYKINQTIVDHAADLMRRGRVTMLAGGLAALVVIVAILLTNGRKGSMNTVLVVLTLGLGVFYASSVSSGWHQMQVNKLAKAGFVIEGAEGDELRWQLDFYPDRIDESHLGQIQSLPYDAIKEVQLDEGLLLINYKNNEFVIVSRDTMSSPNFDRAVELVRAAGALK